MAPSAAVAQSLPNTTKVKRPVPPGIQTNGINSSTSSPSPSMSAGRLPPSSKTANAVNGVRTNSTIARSGSRIQRDPPGQLLGRGQRNNSAGMRSAGLASETAMAQSSQPLPYIQTDAYILKKFRGKPPSLIIHLHPTQFRFDKMEGSFSYKSPMKILLEHLRSRTIPDDLIEYFAKMQVNFYEGCMIVQVHDHKTTDATKAPSKSSTTKGKTVPFSIHNYNAMLTPSPYVPYPTAEATLSKSTKSEGGNEDSKLKLAEQKDKENMPAPAIPADGQRTRTSPSKVPVVTIVLHPTQLSKHRELAVKVTTPQSLDSDNRQDANAPLSSTAPPTPLTAVPPTPQGSMPPPAKRQKKAHMELDYKLMHAFEAQTTLLTTAPLFLEPVESAAQCAALLEALAHPMHSEKVPAPKTRKRTVAEMAADEAHAAEEERYMTILDERLSSGNTGAQGGAISADADGQAGGASFEPRFERFKALENIKVQIEEKKKAEKIRQQEVERKRLEQNEREKSRVQAEERKREEHRALQMQQQQSANLRTQQDLQRRTMAAQAQQQPQNLQNMSQPMQQNQHAHGHPQANGAMPNGIQGQPQRFHQQVSQAQISSPIVRNGTPQSHGHSSPIANNMGNVPMQQSTSSMGGSPPRPGSVVHQNHQQMGAPMSHAMSTQRSQQSHAGTPRLPNSTPLMQSTPVNGARSMSQTPRMPQGSPIPGSMPQGQMMAQGMNPQVNQQAQQMAQQQQAILHQQLQQQQNLRRMNPAAMNPQQLAMYQQMQRQHQMQQQQGGQMNPQLAQQMARQPNMLPQNMAQNFMNSNNMTPQQMQQFQQMQMHNQQQGQQPQNPQMTQQQHQIQMQANNMWKQQLAMLQTQYPNGIPNEILQGVKQQVQARAQQAAQHSFQQLRKHHQQQQMMLAAQNGMNGNMNGMPNGMNGMNGMQRPQGM